MKGLVRLRGPAGGQPAMSHGYLRVIAQQHCAYPLPGHPGLYAHTLDTPTYSVHIAVTVYSTATINGQPKNLALLG